MAVQGGCQWPLDKQRNPNWSCEPRKHSRLRHPPNYIKTSQLQKGDASKSDTTSHTRLTVLQPRELCSCLLVIQAKPTICSPPSLNVESDRPAATSLHLITLDAGDQTTWEFSECSRRIWLSNLTDANYIQVNNSMVIQADFINHGWNYYIHGF